MNGKWYIFISHNPGQPNIHETKKGRDILHTCFGLILSENVCLRNPIKHSGGSKRATRGTPLSGSIFFHFHAVFDKKSCQAICWRTQPALGLAPSSGKSWIRHYKLPMLPRRNFARITIVRLIVNISFIVPCSITKHICSACAVVLITVDKEFNSMTCFVYKW